MKVYGNEESFFSPFSNYHGSNLDSTFWLLWAADLLKTSGEKDRPIFSWLLNDKIEEAKVESVYFKAFFFAYLRETSITLNTEMHLPKDLDSSASWLNPATKYTITRMQKVAGLEKLLKDEEWEQYKAISINGLLNLIQWIDYVNNIEKNDVCYELINSELMSVFILLSVIKEIENKGENIHSVIIHPENFYLNVDEIRNGWSYIISKIDKGEFLDIAYEQMQNLNSSSYDYPKNLNKELSKNTSMSYGLGIIFLQLLSKKTILPWALNSEQVGFEWQYVLQELQGQGRISSLSFRILSACLSPRQRENIILSQMLGDGYVHEAFRDNPEIKNWMQLKQELTVSLQQLRINLISVADEEHRQLTIIDLD